MIRASRLLIPHTHIQVDDLHRLALTPNGVVTTSVNGSEPVTQNLHEGPMTLGVGELLAYLVALEDGTVEFTVRHKKSWWRRLLDWWRENR